MDAELGTAVIERGDHVDVAVGVGPAGDTRERVCHCGHCPFVGLVVVVGWPHVPGGWTRQGRASATGSYEVTFTRPVRARWVLGLGRQFISKATEVPRGESSQTKPENPPDTLTDQRVEMVDEQPQTSSLSVIHVLAVAVGDDGAAGWIGGS